jgi:hypothetical protein
MINKGKQIKSLQKRRCLKIFLNKNIAEGNGCYLNFSSYSLDKSVTDRGRTDKQKEQVSDYKCPPYGKHQNPAKFLLTFL